MEIIDKNGYLESALEYIDKNIVSGRGLQKIAIKAGIQEDLLKNLSLALAGFSEKTFVTILHQEIEDRHSSVDVADAEVSSVDVSIDTQKKKAFIFVKLVCDIVIDG